MIQKNKTETKANKEKSENNLIVIIRISGMVKVRQEFNEALYRLRLRRKYACVIIKPNKTNLGMLEKVKHYVAFGEIKKEVLLKLIKERAKSIEGDKREIKFEGVSSVMTESAAEKVAEGLISGKSLADFGLKPFFRLHPPRKGIDSKRPYPDGVLGKNKEINELVERML
ncbi:MAG: uL30 family ribosomal protein [Nanoarchaeota archaeon]